MTRSDGVRLTFRPWGWAAVNASSVPLFAVFVYMVGSAQALEVLSPALLAMLLWQLVGFTISVEIEGDQLRWRTLFSSDVAPMSWVASVHPGGWWSDRRTRFIDIADGRKIRVTVGPEFTRLLAALQQRIPDLALEDVRPASEP